MPTPDAPPPDPAAARELATRYGILECGVCLTLGYVDLLERWRPECPTCRGTGRTPDGFAERAAFIRVQCEFVRTLCHQPPCDEEEQPRTAESLYCNDSLCRHCSLWRQGQDLLGLPAVARGRPYAASNEYRWLPPDFASWFSPHRRCDDGTATIDWSRGFVSSVTCPLAALVAPDGKSPTAAARGLFGGHPVERVTVSDKEPSAGRFTNEWWWYKSTVRPMGERDNLPDDLVEAMREMRLGKGCSEYRYFPSPTAALSALSTALVGWLRAGLPGWRT